MSEDVAIEIGKKLEALKEKWKCKQIDGYVRRAEDFPGLMLQAGLVAATIFYLSKANLDDVSKYYDYWKSGSVPQVSRGGEEGKGKEKGFDICEDLGEGASKGYSVYTASLLYVFGKVIKECSDKGVTPNDVLDCLNQLMKGELRYERTLAPILISIKEISDLLSPESREEIGEGS
ncbi:type III-B CRISPR module-associated protein Cmr5 [Acidilobus sp.]|uniref:type III-B CRISPR module-associated protein Cmr5 n=1 Tax=Acidilobus sp. TaxID=1872109 RepID=UPI003D04DF3B